MINTLNGPVISITGMHITLMVGPIGLALQVPNAATLALNQEVTLWTYMHWNQEQGPSLYGFQTEIDKTIFLLIISCSGIGPKIGLTALEQLGSTAFIQAVQEGDDKLLSKVSGIGAKKAEQMIVSLKHKIQKLIKTGVQFEGAHAMKQIHELSEVLTSLNYSRREIDAACNWLADQNKGAAAPFDKLLRQALSFLAKKA